METFSTLLAICAGNSPVTRSFDVFFDLCPNNGGVNNREAGDLRRYRAHYDVIVMIYIATKHGNMALPLTILNRLIKSSSVSAPDESNTHLSLQLIVV